MLTDSMDKEIVHIKITWEEQEVSILIRNRHSVLIYAYITIGSA